MKQVTVCFPIRAGKVLLGRKTQKIGAGSLNGFGGFVEDGESIREATARELKEETGLVADPNTLEMVATAQFLFSDKEEQNLEGTIFFVHNWEGEPRESEEMKELFWYLLEDIPYEEMLPHDSQWLPKVFRGARGHFSIRRRDNGGDWKLEDIGFKPFADD